ncbi:hypothetical protein [Streptomyces sp. NPDC018584]|uniref:hypothetical protein n=1 Tax=unclassified Streptomyces TaxID=2593676 RepID=UPI003793FCDB
MRKTCKHRLPDGALCGAVVEGRPYRVELNMDEVRDLWRCGPHVFELERTLLQMLADGEKGKPTRVKLFRDDSGVLATSEDIRTWFLMLLKNSDDQDWLTEEQLAMVKGLQDANPGRLKNELVELWQRLRPQLNAPENWEDVTPEAILDALREALAATPEQLTQDERRMIVGLREGETLSPTALALFGRLQSTQRVARRS